VGFATGNVVGSVADDDDIAAAEDRLEALVGTIQGKAGELYALVMVATVGAGIEVDVMKQIGEPELHGGDFLHITGKHRIDAR
jgi:hypothetical protein